MTTNVQSDKFTSFENVPDSVPQHPRRPSSLDLRDLSISPVLSISATALMLVSCTCLIGWLQTIAHTQRPFTLFYFIPVAFGAAFYGVRGGIVTALCSIVLSRLFLMHLSTLTGSMKLSDDIELFALAFGTFTVAIVTGRLRTVLSQLSQANIDLRDSERRRTGFNREVLLAVTGGRLMLCEADELQALVHGEPTFKMDLNEPVDASQLRHAIKDYVEGKEMSLLRLDDICTAATEAATNAVKHGYGGRAKVWIGTQDASVLIEDEGTGISPAQLARATLERGFSTRISLGMGYYMMLEAVDSLALCTSPSGTSILLTVGNSERTSAEQNLLAHYTAL